MAISAPFLIVDANAYFLACTGLAFSFDITQSMLWRHFSKETFDSKEFNLVLGAIRNTLFVIYFYFVFKRYDLGKKDFKLERKPCTELNQRDCKFIFELVGVSNIIGTNFSRVVHF